MTLELSVSGATNVLSQLKMDMDVGKQSNKGRIAAKRANAALLHAVANMRRRNNVRIDQSRHACAG